MDKANWTPEEAVQLARELSNWGTHYRNAVASLYNTFSFELSNYWRGKNYNIVAEYVNEHYDEFDNITNAMCVTIPSAIQNIAALQAEDGLGSITTFNYEIADSTGADSAVAFNLIPMTEESADGSIVLTQDVVTKYIDGNGEPSLIYYQERMEEYMNSYCSTLDQFSSIKEFNDALKAAYEAIENFKTFSTTAVKNIIEETKIRADVELGKISETDASTKDLAVTVLNNDSAISSGSSNSTRPNSASSYVGGNTTRPNSISKFIGSDAKNSSTRPNSAPTYIGDLMKDSKKTSNTNTSSDTQGTKYDKPIGHEIPENIKQQQDAQTKQNKQVITDYLNSDYEKGSSDDHTYEINGQKMYIDNIKDNGDSYTVTYYDQEKFDANPGNYTDPDTMDIKK